MFLSAVSVLVVAQLSLEVLEVLINYPVFLFLLLVVMVRTDSRPF